MARLNLTVPDALYARLERLRDRINVSRVCAIALEKELDMLEARPAVTEPRLERLVRRLQTRHEKWYRRGHEDGTDWAVEAATREELFRIADELGDEQGDEIARRLHDQDRSAPWFPQSFKVDGRLRRWVVQDAGPAATSGHEPGEDGWSGEPDGRPEGAVDVDKGAYFAGWRDAVKEIWQVVSKALRS
jgi:hypothetical protein